MLRVPVHSILEQARQHKQILYVSIGNTPSFPLYEAMIVPYNERANLFCANPGVDFFINYCPIQKL